MLSIHRSALPFLALAITATARTGACNEPSGRVLAFIAARNAAQALDPSVEIPSTKIVLHSGDVLEYELLVPEEKSRSAGIEIDTIGGARLTAPAVEKSHAWTTIRVPLDQLAEKAIASVRLAARDAQADEMRFYVDDLRIRHADGTSIDLFVDDLQNGVPFVRDVERGAGVVTVALTPDLASGRAPAALEVAEPWAPFDLATLRGLDATKRAEKDPTVPEGLAWVGPCVPMRFAPRGSACSFAALGQRLGLEPLQGGRFYEIWLALTNDAPTEVETTLTLLGVDLERRAITLHVAPRTNGAYQPAPGEGFPARGYALIEVDAASAFGLRSIELPRDEHLHVLAISVCWRRDAVTDAHFRSRWLAQEVRARAEFQPEDRAALTRYLRNRRFGAVFGEPDGEDDAERSLFDTLLAGDVPLFRVHLGQRVKEQIEFGQPRKSSHIDLVGMLPDENAHAIAAALASRTAKSMIAGDGRTLERLAVENPTAMTALAEAVHAGTWCTIGAPWCVNGFDRLDEAGILRALEEGQVTTSNAFGAPAKVVRLDGDIGRLRHLPQLLVASGVDLVLADEHGAHVPVAFSRWSDEDGASLLTLAPAVRIDGPLRLDPDRWRPWMQAVQARGRPGRMTVFADASVEHAREDADLVAEMVQCDVAPQIAWIDPHALALEIGEKALNFAIPEPIALHDGARDPELAPCAALRRAERAVARAEMLAAVARSSGVTFDAGRDIARALLGAASLAPAGSVQAALDVEGRATAAAGNALETAAAALDTSGSDVPVIAFNTLPWSRTALVEVPDNTVRASGPDGLALVGQASSRGGVMFALDMPSLGAVVCHARRDAKAPLETGREPASDSVRTVPVPAVSVEGWHMRSPTLDLEIDPRNGGIVALRTRPGDFDVFRGQADRLVWLAGEQHEPITKLDSAAIVERGPLRAIVRTVRSSAHARVTVDYVVTAVAPWIEIQTKVDHSDAQGDVVALFPLAHSKLAASADVPFGAANVLGAPDELRALDGALTTTDGIVSTALLGGGDLAVGFVEHMYRVVLASRGVTARESAFAIAAVAGGPRKLGARLTAREYLEPLVVRATSAHPGTRGTRAAFLTLARYEHDGRTSEGTTSGLELLSLTPTRAGDGWLLWISETRGEAGRAQLAFDRPVFGAQRVDLFEKPITDLELDQRLVELPLRPHQLVAVRVQLAP